MQTGRGFNEIISCRQHQPIMLFKLQPKMVLPQKNHLNCWTKDLITHQISNASPNSIHKQHVPQCIQMSAN